MVPTTLQKVFNFICHFSLIKVKYINFPCQIDALGMIWIGSFNNHISAQGLLVTNQLKKILKLVTEPDSSIYFI